MFRFSILSRRSARRDTTRGCLKGALVNYLTLAKARDVGCNFRARANKTKSLHAEYLAIRKLSRRCRNLSIVSVRLTEAGKLCMSRPCSHCLHMIRLVGIKYVYYSDQNGVIVKTRPDRIVTHPSGGLLRTIPKDK